MYNSLIINLNRDGVVRIECFSAGFFIILIGALNTPFLLWTIVGIRANVDSIWRYPHMASGALMTILTVWLAMLSADLGRWLESLGNELGSMLLVLSALLMIWGVIQGWRTRRAVEYRRQHALLCLIALGTTIATWLVSGYFFL